MKRVLAFLTCLFMSLSASAQFSNGQVLTAPALNAALAGPTITSGTINGSTIGNVTPRPGTFTTLNATSTTTGTLSLSGSLTLGTPLSVPNGGTGQVSLTNHGVLIGAGSTAITQSAVGTTGQMLIGVSGGDPVWGNNPTITGGSISGATISAPINGSTIDNAVIGGTIPTTGTFTILRGNSLAKVIADSPTSQSIPSSTLTTITNWTSRLDVTSSFVASTGTFTAPRTGRYQVSAEYQLAPANYSANNEVSIVITRNGTQTRTGRFVVGALTGAIINSPCITAMMDLTASDTVTIQAFQNSGGAINTATGNSANVFLTINELP